MTTLMQANRLRNTLDLIEDVTLALLAATPLLLVLVGVYLAYSH